MTEMLGFISVRAGIFNQNFFFPVKDIFLLQDILNHCFEKNSWFKEKIKIRTEINHFHNQRLSIVFQLFIKGNFLLASWKQEKQKSPISNRGGGSISILKSSGKFLRFDLIERIK